MTSDRPSVRLAGVTLRRGTGADPIDLVGHPGEIVTLGHLDPTARTEALAVIAGAEIAAAGTVEVCGGDPRTRNVARRIGYLTGDAPLPSDSTPAELLRHLASVFGADRPRARARAHELVEAFLLDDVRVRPIRDLSTGQARRVAVAAVLATDPDVAILDSPTAGLDPDQRAAAADALTRFAATGRTVVINTWDT